jgi:hypothetical protein
MLNPNDLIKQKAALEAQLKALNENIEKNKYTDEQFIELLNSNFKKPEALIWVKIGDKAEQWPESKRGKLSDPYKTIVEAAGFTKLSEYIAKFKISEEEANKLNA